MGEGRFDDEDAGRADPVPAADRLWRHPAELGAEQAAANLAARHAAGRRWPSMAVSFVAGAALVGFAWLLTANDPAPVESDGSAVVVLPQSTAVAVAGPISEDEWANEVAQANLASVVELQFGDEADIGRAHAVLYDSDGFLMAPAHSLQGATDITAFLATGQGLPAQVIAVDTVSGIAVLKVPSPELEPPTFSLGRVAPRDRLVGIAAHTADGGPLIRGVDVLGDSQVAVLPDGNLLSGLFRLSDDLDDMWAGAPIVDENGGIVAMAVRSRSGVDYAIPTTLARRITDDLITTGETEHVSWLGVSLDPNLSDELKREREVLGGVLVTRVWEQTPAAQAGLVAGDVVVGLGSVNVLDTDDLNEALRALQPGETVELRYSRRVIPEGPPAPTGEAIAFGGELHTTTVVLGAQPYRV